MDCGFLSDLRRGRGWLGYCQTFSVKLCSTESPASSYKALVLAAMYQGWNLLPISALSVGCMRGLCHNPFIASRRRAPLASCGSSSSMCFLDSMPTAAILLTCETQSLTRPSRGTFPCSGESRFSGKKFLSELGVG